MLRFALLLLPSILMAGQPRFARLGEIVGRPEVRLHPADGWRPALRNTPLIDGAWVRTGAGSRAEIELDEGSVLRLEADSLCEFSDYTTLATGQRVTLIWLESGVAYFTGEARPNDSLVLALPGARATIGRGARVRLEASGALSRVSVIEGSLLFTSTGAELELQEGRSARVEPVDGSQFSLENEVPPLASDVWSESRDKLLAAANSTARLPAFPFGTADLDAGAWLDGGPYGAVWKPTIPLGWAPFREGRWEWYDGMGYTWIAHEPWGWLPYHFGRWARIESAGWVWVPGPEPNFSPGDVFWLRGAGRVAWGLLAPGESWDGHAQPQLYSASSITYASYAADSPSIDPAGYAASSPAGVLNYALAPPSPALPAARLKAARPVRAAIARIGSGSYQEEVAAEAVSPPPPPVEEPGPETMPPPPPEPIYVQVPGPTRVIVVEPDQPYHPLPPAAKPPQPPPPPPPAGPARPPRPAPVRPEPPPAPKPAEPTAPAPARPPIPPPASRPEPPAPTPPAAPARPPIPPPVSRPEPPAPTPSSAPARPPIPPPASRPEPPAPAPKPAEPTARPAPERRAEPRPELSAPAPPPPAASKAQPAPPPDRPAVPVRTLPPRKAEPPKEKDEPAKTN